MENEDREQQRGEGQVQLWWVMSSGSHSVLCSSARPPFDRGLREGSQGPTVPVGPSVLLRSMYGCSTEYLAFVLPLLGPLTLLPRVLPYPPFAGRPALDLPSYSPM